MRFIIFLIPVIMFFSECANKQNVVSNTCAEGRTTLDGVCVREEVADYVSCVRAQGAQLKGANSQSLSADVGYFGVNASIARDVSEQLEKKYSTSDKAMMAIIEQCNRLAGISNPTTKPEPKLHKTTAQDTGSAKSCLDIKESNPGVKDGIYGIDVDGPEGKSKPFKVYCNMSKGGGGWALFAHHSDGLSNVEKKDLIDDSGYGVLSDEKWRALRDNAKSGIMTIDENGRIATISLSKLNSGNCTATRNLDSLLTRDYRIASGGGGIWHNENRGCTLTGADYSMIQLKGSEYKSFSMAGAAIYQFSNTKFDRWPYRSPTHSYKEQNTLLYFIK